MMANKNIFSTSKKTVPVTDTVNAAGGKAYSFDAKHMLAQIASTNCFNGTFYADANTNLDLAKTAVQNLKNDAEFIAKVAVYGRDKAYMKDMPAFITVMLADIDTKLFHKVFDKVIDNGKMLRNFCQIARSGATGRKYNLSAGACRKAIQRWFNVKSPYAIFRASVGNDPSMRDMLRMGRPKPSTPEKNALFGYLIGKNVEFEALPQIVKEYETYKKTREGTVPNVDFRMLDSLGLGSKEWTEIARNAGWMMTRMNLNTFQRHDVFKSQEMVDLVASKLSNREEIENARAFPYQLFQAYQAASDVPHKIREALQDAMEIAIANVPVLKGKVLVAVDTSRSMRSAITGYRRGATSTVRCVDVAALFASAILRTNKDAEVVAFDTGLYPAGLNPRDTVITNAQKLAAFGGRGTNCSLPLANWNHRKIDADVVVYVSDCESWVDSSRYYGGTGMMTEWTTFQNHNPKAKLICIDLTPRGNSQVKQHKNILQVGGFSDSVFSAIASFAEFGWEADHWVSQIESVNL